MNCIKCGNEIKSALCDMCNTNHNNLLHKMADDAQVSRDYNRAIEYYELIINSTEDKDEINDISKTMARLGFALTDLTGNSLRKETWKKGTIYSLRTIFIASIIITLFLIGYNLYKVL